MTNNDYPTSRCACAAPRSQPRRTQGARPCSAATAKATKWRLPGPRCCRTHLHEIETEYPGVHVVHTQFKVAKNVYKRICFIFSVPRPRTNPPTEPELVPSVSVRISSELIDHSQSLIRPSQSAGRGTVLAPHLNGTPGCAESRCFREHSFEKGEVPAAAEVEDAHPGVEACS